MREIDAGSTDDAPPPRRGRGAPVVSRWWRTRRRLTSVPVLAGTLLVFTLLSAGPLQGVDTALHQQWSASIMPQWRSFIAEFLDPVAGQAVAVPILGVIAVGVSWVRKSWRPFFVACLAEFLVVGFVGAFKVGIGRQSPELGDPMFFHGGIIQDGWHGISYPSGHAAEAILLYGIMVYLLLRYCYITRRLYRIFVVIVVIITAMTVIDSFYLGWHWFTDLIGGMLAGGLVLRVTVWADEVVPSKLVRAVRHSRHDRIRRLGHYLNGLDESC